MFVFLGEQIFSFRKLFLLVVILQILDIVEFIDDIVVIEVLICMDIVVWEVVKKFGRFFWFIFFEGFGVKVDVFFIG